MIIINGTVTGQRLALDRTVVATGITIGQLKLSFSPEWDGYVKVAVFFKDKDKPYRTLFNDNGVANIPSEVANETGTCFIGVFGTLDNKVITTEAIGYNFRMGAITKDLLVPDPTPDIYTQLLSAYNTLGGAITDERLKAAVDLYIDEHPDSTKGATDEQAAQISQNTSDISQLKQDIANTKYQLSESIVEISDDVKNIITKTPTEEKTDVEATEIINGSIILSSGNLSKNQYTTRFVVNRYDNVNRGKYEVHGYAQGNQCLYVVKKGDEVKTYQKVGDTIDAAGTKTLDLTIEEDGCTVYVGAYESVAGWLKKYGEKKTLNDHIEVPQIDIAKITKSNLYGKKVTLNGDSIAYGQGTGGTGFMDYIAEKYSMTLDKKAVSGGTIADLSKRYPDKHCICNTVSDMAKDADYVIFEGGYNDWYLWAQIGAITDTMSADLDTSKFYGALESICRQALEIWKGKKIGFVITHKINDAWRTQKQEGNTYPTLDGYYQAIRKVCEKYSIPYLDLSRVSRFNTELADYKLYTYNSDGIHPIKEGYGNFYVPSIERWMEQL